MYNSPCISCKKPMNGGVYRKSNECPHCSMLQDSGVLAKGKARPKALAKRPTAEVRSKPSAPSKKASPSPTKKTQQPTQAPKPSLKQAPKKTSDDELAAALAAHRAALAVKKRKAAATSHVLATARNTQQTPNQLKPKQQSPATKPVNRSVTPKSRPKSTTSSQGNVQKRPAERVATGGVNSKTRAEIALNAINKAVSAEKKRSS